MVITSATLNDRPEKMFDDDTPELWTYARARTGVAHLKSPVTQGAFASPFDYAEQTRVFVINDVDRTDDRHPTDFGPTPSLDRVGTRFDSPRGARWPSTGHQPRGTRRNPYP